MPGNDLNVVHALLAVNRRATLPHPVRSPLTACRESRNILEQLETGHYKVFEHPVGEEFDKDRLVRFCRQVLR